MEENITLNNADADLINDLVKKIADSNDFENLTTIENLQVLRLAYIGDTIFDLFSRDLLLKKYSDNIKMNDLSNKRDDYFNFIYIYLYIYIYANIISYMSTYQYTQLK